MHKDQVPVAIVGAGPYGLSLAANLSAAKIGFRIFGTPMAFWSAIATAGQSAISSPSVSARTSMCQSPAMAFPNGARHAALNLSNPVRSSNSSITASGSSNVRHKPGTAGCRGDPSGGFRLSPDARERREISRASGRPGDGPQWIRLSAPALRSSARGPVHPHGQCQLASMASRVNRLPSSAAGNQR